MVNGGDGYRTSRAARPLGISWNQVLADYIDAEDPPPINPTYQGRIRVRRACPPVLPSCPSRSFERGARRVFGGLLVRSSLVPTYEREVPLRPQKRRSSKWASSRSSFSEHWPGHRQGADSWRRPGGFIITTIIGIVGALLGGFLASAIFGGDPLDEFFDISTWITAIIGAIILLLIYRAVTGRRSAVT